MSLYAVDTIEYQVEDALSNVSHSKYNVVQAAMEILQESPLWQALGVAEIEDTKEVKLRLMAVASTAPEESRDSSVLQVAFAAIRYIEYRIENEKSRQ